MMNDNNRELVNSMLINKSWVNNNLEEFKKDNHKLKLLEIDRSNKYDQNHIPGAIKINWTDKLVNNLGRNIMKKDVFEDLMGENGVTEDSSIVLYGDTGNWYASHAFWVCRYFGHKEVRMLNGGRRSWRHEGYKMTDNIPTVTPTQYNASDKNKKIKKYVERSKPV